MKPLEKRVSKLCEGMTNTSRIRAILDAIRVDDIGLRDKLMETAPRLSYKATDARVVDTIEAAQILSLRFDRTFFHLLATCYACQLPHVLKEESPKDILTGIDNMDTELLFLTNGARIFAERIGLDVNQVLAFSTALDIEGIYEEIIHPGDTLSDDEMDKANEVADAFQETWFSRGNVIKNFGDAA